jgi:hypothetical protein
MLGISSQQWNNYSEKEKKNIFSPQPEDGAPVEKIWTGWACGSHAHFVFHTSRHVFNNKGRKK